MINSSASWLASPPEVAIRYINPLELINRAAASVLIRQGWNWGKETTDALEDYPRINDERVSEVEMEWEDEAWKDWLRSDLFSPHRGQRW